jgi:hypothetical protein
VTGYLLHDGRPLSVSSPKIIPTLPDTQTARVRTGHGRRIRCGFWKVAEQREAVLVVLHIYHLSGRILAWEEVAQATKSSLWVGINVCVFTFSQTSRPHNGSSGIGHWRGPRAKGHGDGTGTARGQNGRGGGLASRVGE